MAITDALTPEKSIYELRRETEAAQAKGDAAREQLRAAHRRLETAARKVCGDCLNLTYSPEFGYTFCHEVGSVSGRHRPLSDIAKIDKDGKFICERFRPGGKLGKAGYGGTP